MKTVADVLAQKGHEHYSVAPDDSVFDALMKMADKNVGALLVMQGGELVGIISERDYARKVVLQGRTSPNTLVRDIMTPEVTVVEPRRSVEECMALMTTQRFRHAPVVENGKIVGVISLGDLVKTVISEQKFVIEQLEQYITR
jgi:CBS domain-containing protein